MHHPFKIISNQISPNLKMADFLMGVEGFIQGKNINFSEIFGHQNYKLANAARTLLSAVLEILSQEKSIISKKTVGIPAFCCSVMASPFLSQGFEIIWLETDENGLLDFEDFLRQSDKISILLAPHIFGQKLDIKKFTQVCQTKNIFLIEDGSLAFEPSKNISDSEADLLWVSFGREKDFSCVSGGGIFWPDTSPHAAQFQSINFKNMPMGLELKHIFQIFIFNISIPFWFFGGKIWPFLAKKLKLLPLVFTPAEKKGISDFPTYELPASLQSILKRQFVQRKKNQQHREYLAKKWAQVLPQIFREAEIIIPKNFLRVIIKFKTREQRDAILIRAKKNHFFLREWDGDPIGPGGISNTDFHYQKGHCPKAEKFNHTYLTLPTNLQTSVADVDNFEQIFSS